MALTVDQLLLTDDRKTQLIAALENTGEDEPLERCIAEAEADVARLTAGYTIAQSSLDGWARVIALYKAFLAAELGIPEDIATAYKDVKEELTAIAEGKRPNLPREEDDDETTPSPSTGSWGSKDKII